MTTRLLLGVLLMWALILPGSLQAATLSALPSATTVNAGDLVTVRVSVNPQGTAINNAEAVLRFPSGILQVVSISKAGSLFSLWVEEPTYSNSAGTISFNGGVPTPGVSSAGTAISVTFQAVRAGTATLTVSNAAVRANDGYGTDVLTSAAGTQLTVTSAPVPVVAPATSAVTTVTPASVPAPTSSAGLASITVSSPTHPDSERWYSDTSPTFTWVLPRSAVGVQLGIDRSADTDPGVTYSNAIVEKTVEALDDGTWYFRMRARSAAGWGDTYTYRVNIDTQAPEITSHAVTYDERDRSLRIALTADDALSGIARYEAVVDSAEPHTFEPNETGEYVLNVRDLRAGAHVVTLRAYDQAGNAAETSETFTTTASVMDAPVLTLGSFTLTLGASLVGMALISLISLLLALYGWYRLFRLQNGAHPSLTGVTKEVHRSFSLYKKDLEKNLKLLESTRASRNLTSEESRLHKRMLQNLADLERYIEQQLSDKKEG